MAIDFRNISHEIQKEIMSIITQVPFENFVIADSEIFGDRELQFVIDNSTKLRTLGIFLLFLAGLTCRVEIVRCPSITGAGIRLLLFRDSPSFHLSAIVTDCDRVRKSLEKEFKLMDSVSLVVVSNNQTTNIVITKIRIRCFRKDYFLFRYYKKPPPR